MTATPTRRQTAEAVLTNLRTCGPGSIAEIRSALGITKRQAEDAIWLLANAGDVEYDYPISSPFVYKPTKVAWEVAAMREP